MMADSPETAEDRTCSRLSLIAGEPLPGSAGLAEVYFLVEYSAAWEAKAFESSNIPEEVKARLFGISKSIPASKILLIRQQHRGQAPGIHFFVAIASESDPRLYAFTLESYLDLLALDLPAVIRGDAAYQPNLSAMDLILVCTNGRRDQCCARYGVPLNRALERLAGEATWECSHMGGHRFAANLYHLPAGIMYGRLREADAPGLLAALQAGKFQLSNLRGRTTYSPAAQAAEYYLREQTGVDDYGAYHLLDAQESEPGLWQVNFRSTADQHVYSIGLLVEKSAEAVYESCALDKQTSLVHYRKIGA